MLSKEGRKGFDGIESLWRGVPGSELSPLKNSGRQGPFDILTECGGQLTLDDSQNPKRQKINDLSP
jgi:hypothetical protein